MEEKIILQVLAEQKKQKNFFSMFPNISIHNALKKCRFCSNLRVFQIIQNNPLTLRHAYSISCSSHLPVVEGVSEGVSSSEAPSAFMHVVTGSWHLDEKKVNCTSIK
ncbi:MAG: hypothetical protein MJZ22_03720 [Candidatus Saccharibacteria bacterium]|nr:hypothetical protein [Candidatus Saccharibacteria bacterium]